MGYKFIKPGQVHYAVRVLNGLWSFPYCTVQCSGCTNEDPTIGNIELLEADTTRDEVLSGKRKPYSAVTSRLYARLPGGRLSCPTNKTLLG